MKTKFMFNKEDNLLIKVVRCIDEESMLYELLCYENTNGKVIKSKTTFYMDDEDLEEITEEEYQAILNSWRTECH